MKDSLWLKGPTHFLNVTEDAINLDQTHELVNPDDDREIRPTEALCVTKTKVSGNSSLGTHRYEIFSRWRRLVQAIARLKIFARMHKDQKEQVKSTLAKVATYRDAELFVIKSVQREVYGLEISCIQQNMHLPKDSSIYKLSPFLDADGILRVGGRIKMADLGSIEKTPLLLPGKHHVSRLLVLHFHEEVKHQGRSFTEGAVRSAGYWITGCKNLISSILHKCVICRKLRGRLDWQKMADLPKDRLEVAPPFTNVGVDTFGPWSVVSRKTRAGSASSKRWAIMYTYLVTRAIHIEVVDEMSSTAFINSLKRFTAIRGKVKILRSDRGTNFVGAMDDLHIDTINVEDGPVKNHLYNSGTTWIFNPPHASHMGGVWERMVGVTRKILDSMLSNVSDRSLTHDVLCTFMAEVCAIINNRPLVPVSSDVDFPFVLSPASILTQKVGDSCTTTNDNPETFSLKDLYKSSWRRVQALSDAFWARWRKEYLTTLQKRRKWNDDRRNFSPGDVVLIRVKNVHRNQWPLGVVTHVFPSTDNLVRKVEESETSKKKKKKEKKKHKKHKKHKHKKAAKAQRGEVLPVDDGSDGRKIETRISHLHVTI
ncbi:uncharacterized protein LOC130053697 [Ostrea edulis]|uniref:uncharacterized protein LOC130053697 n=1 Tax=Ostrea edulis TaxID=37623 RepID=UPI0024AEF428|nr:uncharacterized protein LOC130053697 [Ostrea edulis]